MILAPPWAFSAEAIDARGDTHLSPGIHLRVLPSPAAGIPATPLLVYRALFDREATARLAEEGQVAWIDSYGNPRTAPFELDPNNPVTAHLPGGRAIWAELTARALGTGAITVAALVNGPDGPVSVAERALDPLTVAAQRIDAVRVSGRGTVIGLRWIDRDDAVKGAPFRLFDIWSLPVAQQTPRYLPTPHALDEAKQRVAAGAPVRLPQYAVMGQTDPAASPLAGYAFSLKRIERIAPEIDRWLKMLLYDTSQPTPAMIDVQPFDDLDGRISLPVEPQLIAASIDPDVGHYLGLGGVDRTEIGPGQLALYLVRGLWRYLPDQWHVFERITLASRRVATPEIAKLRFPDLRDKGLAPEQDGPFLDLAALAVIAGGAVPARPDRPALLGFEDRGWLPEPPPNVRRHLRTRLRDVSPRSLLAAVADDGVRRTLNQVIGEGRPKPGVAPDPTSMLGMAVTRPVDAEVPGETRIDDRDAREGLVKYRFAEGDWFGRWSEWADHQGPAKKRTVPLAPAVELAYAAPPLPLGPVPEGPLAGTVTVRVAIPRIDDLPPGGRRLRQLELLESIGGAAETTSFHVLDAPDTEIEAHPAPQHDLLVIRRPGPPLERAQQTTIEVKARWADEVGVPGPFSPPARRKAIDPRPPALPGMPTKLLYSARPDATGFARVELVWGSVPGTRYRVFASSEPTLIGALRNKGQGAVADLIAATPAGALRAEEIRKRPQLFGWDAFESVTPRPIVATGTTTRFVHRISGSLDVLAAYRVLTEGPSGGLADISAADVVLFAVPNLGPPPAPLASIGPREFDYDPVLDGVPIEVLVPPGRAAPVAWRVRRSSVPAGDALRMEVVAQGPIAPASTGAEGTRFTVTLTGDYQPWRQYRFVVEVQAGSPPGAPDGSPVPPGEWSAPSAPVTLATIPPGPPAPPTALVPVQQGGAVKLTLTHPAPDTLVGTAFGAYRIELYRLTPGLRPVKLDLAPARVGAAFEAVDADPPPGSAWSARIVDPLGRLSPTVPGTL